MEKPRTRGQDMRSVTQNRLDRLKNKAKDVDESVSKAQKTKLPRQDDAAAAVANEKIITKARLSSCFSKSRTQITKSAAAATAATNAEVPPGFPSHKQKACYSCGEFGHLNATCPKKDLESDPDKRLQAERDSRSIYKLWRDPYWNYRDNSGEIQGPVSLLALAKRVNEGTISGWCEVTHVYVQITPFPIGSLLALADNGTLGTLIQARAAEDSPPGSSVSGCSLSYVQAKLHEIVVQKTARWVRWILDSTLEEMSNKNSRKVENTSPVSEARLVPTSVKLSTEAAFQTVCNAFFAAVVEASKRSILEAAVGQHLEVWMKNQDQRKRELKEKEILEAVKPVVSSSDQLELWTAAQKESLKNTKMDAESPGASDKKAGKHVYSRKRQSEDDEPGPSKKLKGKTAKETALPKKKKCTAEKVTTEKLASTNVKAGRKRKLLKDETQEQQGEKEDSAQGRDAERAEAQEENAAGRKAGRKRKLLKVEQQAEKADSAQGQEAERAQEENVAGRKAGRKRRSLKVEVEEHQEAERAEALEENVAERKAGRKRKSLKEQQVEKADSPQGQEAERAEAQDVAGRKRKSLKVEVEIQKAEFAQGQNAALGEKANDEPVHDFVEAKVQEAKVQGAEKIKHREDEKPADNPPVQADDAQVQEATEETPVTTSSAEPGKTGELNEELKKKKGVEKCFSRKKKNKVADAPREDQTKVTVKNAQVLSEAGRAVAEQKSEFQTPAESSSLEEQIFTSADSQRQSTTASEAASPLSFESRAAETEQAETSTEQKTSEKKHPAKKLKTSPAKDSPRKKTLKKTASKHRELLAVEGVLNESDRKKAPGTVVPLSKGCARCDITGWEWRSRKMKHVAVSRRMLFKEEVVSRKKGRQQNPQSVSRQQQQQQKFQRNQLQSDRRSRVEHRNLGIQHVKPRQKPLKLERSKIHAWGLIAMNPIEPNDFVIEYTGQLIRLIVADIRERQYEKMGIDSSYFFRVDEVTAIDATKLGGLARFINHSCDPNCVPRVRTVEGQKRIFLYAKKAIAIGEELTYDYKFPVEEKKIPCFCGAVRCRGYMN